MRILLALSLAVAPALAQGVPTELQRLLTERPNRMKLVAERYSIDRAQLDRFYTTPLSTRHLARVKRFDLQWQTAVRDLDATELDPAEKRARDELAGAIEQNLAQLEARATSYAATRALVPFAAPVEGILEARRKVLPMDARKTAGVLDRMAGQVRSLTERIESGKLVPVPAVAERAATATTSIRRAMRDWFRFYDTYDPLFSWWMAAPNAALVKAIEAYGKLLAEKAKEKNGATDATDTEPPGSLAAAPAPPHSYVPDLARLLATPHDEMAGVFRAFRGEPRGRRRGRGRRPRHTEEQLAAWRKALGSLDFPKLSRRAQVSYLGLRKEIDVGLRRLRTKPQENIPHVRDKSGIRGRPIGRTALELALAAEMIPYTPEELIAIGDAEYAWCMDEMLKASRELGFGDDWRKALEHVKTLHVDPGGQPVVIRKLMFEAVDFLREHDLLTVPQVAAETLTMIMMTPARQLVNPFFTGGNRISVSFPTSTMAHDAKLQSLRGNNIPFSRATVHHELIPGHNLQFFYDRRFGRTQAGRRRTPFHLEGWAVYFEMLLYRMGFPRITAERAGGPKDAENRIGFLFWRMHRSARITFSLRFHMGMWSAQQCIDFLVDGVGHERDGATAEVRRSFAGSYGPLYQAGYLLGAVQFRKLNEEIVESGRMNARDFHDAVQRAGTMPVTLVRLVLNGEELTADMPLAWKFYGETIPEERR